MSSDKREKNLTKEEKARLSELKSQERDLLEQKDKNQERISEINAEPESVLGVMARVANEIFPIFSKEEIMERAKAEIGALGERNEEIEKELKDVRKEMEDILNGKGKDDNENEDDEQEEDGLGNEDNSGRDEESEEKGEIVEKGGEESSNENGRSEEREGGDISSETKKGGFVEKLKAETSNQAERKDDIDATVAKILKRGSQNKSMVGVVEAARQNPTRTGGR